MRVFPAIAAACVLGLAACGTGAPGPRAASLADGLEIDPVGMLRELHVRMADERLPLLEVEVLRATVTGRDVTLALVPRSTLWQPPGGAAPAQVPATYVLRSQPAPDVEFWQAATFPMTALAVAGTAALHAVAPVTGPGGEVVKTVPSTGALFLAWAPPQVAPDRYVPVTVFDHCDRPDARAVADSARAALLDYLDQLGAEPELVRMVRQEELEREAERLATSQTFTDPVTGQTVGVNVNEVLAQLLDGVAPVDVQLRPTVPVQLDVAGVAPRLQDEPAREAAVFVEVPTRRILGWVPVAGTWSGDDAGMTPDFVVRADITTPAPGNDVAVLIRDIQTPRFDCPPESFVPYDVVVPYDDLAGRFRSVVRLAARSHARVPT